MDHELIHSEKEVDDLISDIHQLIDAGEEKPAEAPAPAPEEAPEPPAEEILDTPAEEPEQEESPAEEIPAQEVKPNHWTDRQRVPKHVAVLQNNQQEAYARWLAEQEEKGEQPPPIFEEEQPKKKKKRDAADSAVQEESAVAVKPAKKSRFGTWLCVILAVLALAAIVTAVFVVPHRPLDDTALLHTDGASTILLAATDEDPGNTDMLMLMTFNAVKKTVSLVSIPRDTAVFYESGTVNIGTVYGRAGGGERGIAALKEAVSTCVGFAPDGCLILSPYALYDFLDTLGGELDGEAAYDLLRENGQTVEDDLIRVQTQRNFLTEIMLHCQRAEAVTKAPFLLEALTKNSVTDLDTANFLWLARTAFLADCANLEQTTLPGTVQEDGTYLLDLSLLVQTINAYCNPYVRAVSADDLQLVLAPDAA